LPGQQTDAGVIRASLSHPRAFEEIFARHYGRVLAYLRARAGHAIGEELAADTFVQAFEHRARFDLRRVSALPWLLGIGTNLLRHHLRRERRQLAALERARALAPAAPEIDLETWVQARAVLPRVIRGVRELPPGERDALLLHAWGELSYAEVAQALEIPLGTVRSRLNRARGRLRELTGPLGAILEEEDERSDDSETKT